MRKCTKHPHSTDDRARACYSKGIQKSLARRLGRDQYTTPTRYEPVRFSPPLVVPGPLATIVWFYGARQRTVYGVN